MIMVWVENDSVQRKEVETYLFILLSIIVIMKIIEQ